MRFPHGNIDSLFDSILCHSLFRAFLVAIRSAWTCHSPRKEKKLSTTCRSTSRGVGPSRKPWIGESGGRGNERHAVGIALERLPWCGKPGRTHRALGQRVSLPCPRLITRLYKLKRGIIDSFDTLWRQDKRERPPEGRTLLLCSWKIPKGKTKNAPLISTLRFGFGHLGVSCAFFFNRLNEGFQTWLCFTRFS